VAFTVATNSTGNISWRSICNVWLPNSSHPKTLTCNPLHSRRFSRCRSRRIHRHNLRTRITWRTSSNCRECLHFFNSCIYNPIDGKTQRCRLSNYNLSGVAVMYIFSACNILLQYFAEADAVNAAVSWLVGDLSRASWWKLPYVLIVFVACFAVNIKLSWTLTS